MKRYVVFSLLTVFMLLLAGCNLQQMVDVTGTLSGVISDQKTGETISGVNVSVGNVTTTTNTSGTYSLETKIGSYTLLATADGYDDYSTTVTINAMANVNHDIEMVPTKGTISGVITDHQTNQPIGGATITVGDQTTTSNGQGAYTLEMLPGSYPLTVTATGYNDYTANVTITAESETTHNVEMGLSTGSVAGVITDFETGSPISGVTITAGDQTSTSDAQGAFSLRLLPGTYTLTASASGYESYTDQVTITAGNEISHNIEMVLITGVLSGNITDEADNPLVGVTVIVGDQETTTDDLGNYEVELIPGTYTLMAQLEGYVNYSASITIIEDQRMTHDVEMIIATGSLSGLITDQTGSPLPGATITVGNSIVTSDEQGVYRLELVPGSYTITAEAIGYHTYSGEVVINEGTETIHDIELVLITGTLVGVITDQTDSPIAGVAVSLEDSTVTTDDLGMYSFEVVPDTYVLTATSTGYDTYTNNVTITADQESTHNIQMVLSTGTISGVITDQSTGEVITGVTVTVGDVTTNTDALGAYSAELVPGTYTLTATIAGYHDFTTDVTVIEGEVGTQNIQMSRITGTLNGVITDGTTGAVLSGATVTVGNETATTDAHGVYSLVLIPGDYTLTASADGYNVYTGYVTVVADEQVTHNFQMTRATGSLVGQVTNQTTGNPLSGVTISVGNDTTTTDPQGVYSFDVLIPGNYELLAVMDGYSDYTSNITIVENEETVHNFSMETSSVTGYVTDGRGGPAVLGATVRIDGTDISTTTDADGYFSINVQPDVEVDLLVEKENRATTRIQDVFLLPGETLETEVPTRAPDWPNSSTVPPTISLNINRGQVISGTLPVELSVQGDLDTFVFYVYLDGEQRYPYDWYEIYSNGGSIILDTTKYPNGDTYFRILAYDDNGNAVLSIIPVTIENIANDSTLPDPIPNCRLETYTWGSNLGFYSHQQKKQNITEKHTERYGIEETFGDSFDLKAAPENGMIYTRIEWDLATGADGYNVYRSFDDVNYQKLGSVTMGRFDDYSPELEVNKTTYYQIVPYNSFGEGTAIERVMTPLPSFNVYLETPTNASTDAPLIPTFTWRTELSETPVVNNIDYYYEFTLWDATDYLIYAQDVGGQQPPTEYTLPIQLEPNGVYSWDISYCEALALYYYQSDGYSAAFSYAGEYTSSGGTGSENGEFIFRTISDPNL